MVILEHRLSFRVNFPDNIKYASRIGILKKCYQYSVLHVPKQIYIFLEKEFQKLCFIIMEHVF